MRVAAIQMRSTSDVATNVGDMTSLVREAAATGARYVQTPEMTGLIQRDRNALVAAVKRQDEDPILAAASSLAGEHAVWLHIGSTPIARDDGAVANRAAVFAPDGQLVATYDKIHMFDVDLEGGESWRESAVYAAGNQATVVRVDDTVFGLAICYDLRFPSLFADLARAGATVLTGPAAFTRQTGQAHWHILLRARAIENGAFMIAAAQGGTHEDGRQTYGHSMIVDPWGAILAEKEDDAPGIITADIDPAQSARARARIPNLKHFRSYQLKTEQQEPAQ